MSIADSSSAGAPPPSLSAGQVLAGRYKVHCFLGQGAVGEVYEAEDLELGGRIAVKILRPEIARDERVIRRFKQEIQLTHRVTHPNVCRTYDLVYHREALQPVRVFLTMELLRGETLEELLARQGRLTPFEAMPIVRQIAGALKAAHEAGVIHRDLKTSNVFLVASGSGVRAVVNDFGLAWSDQDEESTTLTATGELIGSPAYMSPEQVRGETATPASDIYTLGVVLYEMVTGELPFVGKSAFFTALMRLQQPPPAPRSRVLDLDPLWDEVILRCLEREPAARFATADEVVGALLGEVAPPPRKVESARRRLRHWIGASALMLFLTAGSLALMSPRPDSSVISLESPPESADERPAVAVLAFENLSGDPSADHMGDVLVQMLASAPEIRTIPAAGADRTRLLPGADFVVTGTYRVTGSGQDRFEVTVRDGRGVTVAALERSGAEEERLKTLAQLGGDLRKSLGTVSSSQR